MAGLIGSGLALKQESQNVLLGAQQREQERDSANEAMKAAETAQKSNLAGIGAGIGFSAGIGPLVAAGPYGALAGAAIGLLAGSIF